MSQEQSIQFHEAVQGLLAGDFSRLAPLFDGSPCPIIQWHEAGLFAGEPQALEEAFTNACFLGRTEVAEYFLARGIDRSGGMGTGLNAFHWAANRGQLEVVRLLIRHKAALETRNSYGGTVLGGTVWAAVHETKPDHLQIIEALLEAGANVEEAEYPSGDTRIDEILRRYLGGQKGRTQET
jgi:hypothetical protein